LTFIGLFRSTHPESLDQRHWSQGVAGRYLLTSLVAALCCAFRLQLPWHAYSFFLFIPAVLAGAVLFGRGPATYATALTALIALFFFMEPVFSLSLTPGQIPPLALYLLICGSLAESCEWLRRIIAEAIRRRALMAYSYYAANSRRSLSPAPPARVRVDGIDFWRGFILCTIFINHMPGNVFENFTFRNVGFSDAAEAFIYLSGVSLALAYGARFAGGERLGVLMALARRAVKLYGVHIALSLAGLAIFIAGAIAWHAPELLAVHGRDLYISDASLFLVGVLSLGHQLGYFNILPLYIVLVIWAAVLMWLANIDRYLMLVFSVLVYAVSRFGGWNLPSWPVEGTWFLNPLTWQLLLAVGITVGPMLKEGAVPVSRFWFWASAFAVAASAFFVTNGFGLFKGIYDTAYVMFDLNKNNLGLGRLVHFLALTYVIYYSGLTLRLRGSWLFESFAVLGRHSLLIFAVLSLLDAAGQVLIETMRTSAWLDVGLVLGGLAALYSTASLADAAAALERRSKSGYWSAAARSSMGCG